jgi:hypothetical protein
LGFCVATGGAFLILSFYRLLAGQWFVEGDAPKMRTLRRRRSTHQIHPAHHED